MASVLKPATASRSDSGRVDEHVESSSKQRQKLVIVGGGMAGFGLCDRLVRSGSIDDFEITLIGDEPSPAYDRVNLSQFFAGRTAEDLQLATREWYHEHKIDLRTGTRIDTIDRDRQMVTSTTGESFRYDHLVLATGSHPFVPPISGRENEGVFVYRTLQDLESIREYCQSNSVKRGGVIGGGLLGLEAAKILLDLGLSVSVIEMAPGLMPRQLDAEAAALLKSKIQELGVDVQLVRRTESIERTDDGLCVKFSNAEDLDVDLLIVAAGIRPNDHLAEAAGLEIGERRGIKIDETLTTSDTNIYAIGECASFHDHLFGLAAPCYRMADVLAQRLSGKKSRFEGADESAELKLLGVQVASLGRAIGESPGGSVLTHHDGDGYRKLLSERGRIVGASCVGPWDELPQVRQAIEKNSRLWPWQIKRFSRTGSPWAPGGALPVAAWPADSTVCSCLSVSKATITSLIDEGKASVEEIAGCCGASTACGSCRGLIGELVGDDADKTSVPGAKTMLAASGIAMVASIALWIVPPVTMAESVQDSWRSLDVLWRDDFFRQLTGFTLLGLTVLGLTFSLRKRVKWFRWGSYGFWRAAHGVLGTAVLFAMAIHTGMHLGVNLNLMLGLSFLAAIALGALAGVASSLESRATGKWAMQIRLWRPRLTRLHLWVTWPLPVLIALHILSFYWFSD